MSSAWLRSVLITYTSIVTANITFGRLCEAFTGRFAAYMRQKVGEILLSLSGNGRKLLDSLCLTDPTRGQDILHIFSSKQTVELLLIEACGQEWIHFCEPS